MPIALEGKSRSSAERVRTYEADRDAAPDGFSSHEINKREAVAHLNSLLVCAPIDLAGISDEIRRHPNLESLILRLGVSLALSPDEPLNTVEEAVVVLGTSRLRVLIDLWSSMRDMQAESGESQQNSAAGSLSAVATTPEINYLSNFLRGVGFDSPEGALSNERLAAWAAKISPDQMFVLTDLFMHDFFSLLPVIHPGIKEAAAAPSANRATSTAAKR
jgi:hypothetical protein